MRERTEDNTDNIELQFREHYVFLSLIAFRIVKNHEASKDIVQDFFVSYCLKRKTPSFDISFKAYATKAVKNLSLLHLKKEEKKNFLLRDLKARNDYAQEIAEEPSKYGIRLQELINQLPEARKEIFISSIVHNLSYSEIAETKDISINTVKTQMKRAYAFLRDKMTYRTLFFFF